MTVFLFNFLEALLWFLMGAGFLTAAIFRTSKVQYRPLMIRVAAWFLLFGISDLIEMQTGAWWRPVWLLVLKVACVLGLAGCLMSYYKRRG